jgi:hypothetical protein
MIVDQYMDGDRHFRHAHHCDSEHLRSMVDQHSSADYQKLSFALKESVCARHVNNSPVFGSFSCRGTSPVF